VPHAAHFGPDGFEPYDERIQADDMKRNITVIIGRCGRAVAARLEPLDVGSAAGVNVHLF
jgi:hypothetical protein